MFDLQNQKHCQMAEEHREEESEDPESPEEELSDETELLRHFGKYIEARRALPWNQWTFREKVTFFLDRIFFGFLALFVLIFIGEFVYKMWYVSNMKKIVAFLTDSVSYLVNWLSTQERQEELLEL